MLITERPFGLSCPPLFQPLARVNEEAFSAADATPKTQQKQRACQTCIGHEAGLYCIAVMIRGKDFSMSFPKGIALAMTFLSGQSEPSLHLPSLPRNILIIRVGPSDRSLPNKILASLKHHDDDEDLVSFITLRTYFGAMDSMNRQYIRGQPGGSFFLGKLLSVVLMSWDESPFHGRTQKARTTSHDNCESLKFQRCCMMFLHMYEGHHWALARQIFAKKLQFSDTYMVSDVSRMRLSIISAHPLCRRVWEILENVLASVSRLQPEISQGNRTSSTQWSCCN